MDNDSKLPAISDKQVLDYAYISADNDKGDAWTGDDAGDDDGDNLIHIVVKRSARVEVPCLELSIERGATVMDLKTLIQDELADESPCLVVPVERQRLIFQGRMLTDNDQSLADDVKMKLDQVNYVHLAPLPKGATPTTRKQSENKVSTPTQRRQQRRRASRRSERTFNPYTVPPTTRRQPSASSIPNTPPIHMGPNRSLHELAGLQLNPLLCESSRIPPPPFTLGTEDQLHRPPVPPVVPPSVLSMDTVFGLGGAGRHDLAVTDTDQAILQDTQAILPFCRLLPRNLNQIVAGGVQADRLNVEETIVILDELSRRSASLSQSLRLATQAQPQVLSVQNTIPLTMQGIGLPLGHF